MSSAYQGRGWRPRTASMREELDQRRPPWSPWRVNSEWAKLEAVAFYIPGPEYGPLGAPNRIQHLRKINIKSLQKEMRTLARIYEDFGIHVVRLNPAQLTPPLRSAPPNLLFARDLFTNTQEGMILSRMASRVRAGEERIAAAALSRHGVFPRAAIAGEGTLEGADMLWLEPDLALCGVGQRTNAAGFKQLQQILATQGARAIAVPMPSGVQHLLGFLQLPGPRRAILRRALAPKSLRRLLRTNGFKVLELEESREIKDNQGLNFVTIAREQIVMARGCPNLRRAFEAFGLKIMAEVDITQLKNAAGGLACATGIIGRKVIT